MEQIERLKLKLKDCFCDDNELEDLLLTAKSIILNKRFPFSKKLPQDIEPRYLDLQVRIAVDLYNKRGAEGETSHSENGISRTYGTENVSTDLLAEITPRCGVL